MKFKEKHCLLVLLMAFPSSGVADTELYFTTLYRTPHVERILMEAYKRLNIKIKFIYLPAGRSLWSANNGISDGEAVKIMGIEKTYRNLLMVKIPLTYDALPVYTKDVSFTVSGWQSLKPYRIAYQRGVKIIERNLKGVPIEGVATTEQAFMMLAHNRVDLVIADANQAADLLPNYPDIKMLSPAVDSFPVYHYLHKKHADLVPKLEAVLQQMIADKTIKRITQEFAGSVK
jgi:polar amino acid transport system substrate-binding protein